MIERFVRLSRLLVIKGALMLPNFGIISDISIFRDLNSGWGIAVCGAVGLCAALLGGARLLAVDRC